MINGDVQWLIIIYSNIMKITTSKDRFNCGCSQSDEYRKYEDIAADEFHEENTSLTKKYSYSCIGPKYWVIYYISQFKTSITEDTTIYNNKRAAAESGMPEYIERRREDSMGEGMKPK